MLPLCTPDTNVNICNKCIFRSRLYIYLNLQVDHHSNRIQTCKTQGRRKHVDRERLFKTIWKVKKWTFCLSFSKKTKQTFCRQSNQVATPRGFPAACHTVQQNSCKSSSGVKRKHVRREKPSQLFSVVGLMWRRHPVLPLLHANLFNSS